MKKLLAIGATIAALALAVYAASPAATQSWVIKYCADHGMTASTNANGTAYTYAGTEENLMQFVPTREEKALYRWLKKYENLFGSDVITRGHMWTNLVELASGDYQTVLDLNDADDAKVVWYVEHFPRALFIVQNPPDLSMLSQRVKAMGIPQGKEFGDMVKSFTELAYMQMATSIPFEKVEERGNSRIVYTLSTVTKKGA